MISQVTVKHRVFISQWNYLIEVTSMKDIFVGILVLLGVAGACVAGAAYLIDEATKQAKQQAETYA